MAIRNLLQKIKAPQLWGKFARRYGIFEVILIKGDGACKSMIIGDTVIINLNCAAMEGYRKILDVRSYEEVITAKFLHELAHYIKKHYAYKMKQDKIIALEDICEKSLEEVLADPCEREAWDFVLAFKHEKPELFQALVEALKACLH